MLDRLKDALRAVHLRRQEQEGRLQEGRPQESALLASSGPVEGHKGRGYAEMNRGRVAVENPADPGSRGALSAVGGDGGATPGEGSGIMGKIREVFQGTTSSPSSSSSSSGTGPRSGGHEDFPGAETAGLARRPEGPGTDNRAYARAPGLGQHGSIGHEFSVSTLDTLSWSVPNPCFKR
jgi:hypothetical protein